MEMGGTCGLDLLPDARMTGTPVVITTAHERFAVDAFEGEVIDYLLKPVEQNRLFRAIARISRQRETAAGDFIILTDQLHCWPVDPAKIPMIEAEGSYCMVHFLDRKPLTVSRSLKEIEQLLGGHAFIRANRGQIVNLHHIEVIHRPGMGRMIAEVRGHGEIEFSRRQAQAFRLKFAV
jgi:two-component system, LytTR family, response regulator